MGTAPVSHSLSLRTNVCVTLRAWLCQYLKSVSCPNRQPLHYIHVCNLYMMLMSNSLNMYFKQNKSTLAFPDIEW